MELRVERDALADAVVWTARSLPARPPMQVLLGLLLETTESGLSVSGFDYEVSSQISVDVTTAEPGRVLVPGRLLADIVRALPAQPVELRLEGTRVVLTCGAARFTLPTLPVEDYPALPAMPTTAGSLESDVFGAAVAQVALAAGRDDTLPVLTGVRLEIEGDQLTLAATDRYRLAVRTLTWKPEQLDLSATALVPARTLADTAKALTSGPEVTLALATGGAGEGMIGFEGGGRRTTSRLLEGEFPKYRSLLPNESSAIAEVATAPLVEAVKRVALVAARNAPVRLSFSADGVVLEAGGQDDAQASERLECGWEGEPMSIAFNPQYLLDGLGAVDSDTTTLSFTGPTRPAVLTGKRHAPGEVADYRYLLMPVRLSG
ncbi:MAG: polymerase subunit beta [Frankiales bacterium]|jgi:DNA polymerase-3 subunit beta|nr:polymerase subunit beta [Frankiales bacterium]MCW2586213.1 polymerase subunit beta [Frankiales bacterium]